MNCAATVSADARVHTHTIGTSSPVFGLRPRRRTTYTTTYFSRLRGSGSVVAYPDIIAIGAMAACQERGIAIPNELSLTGFENLDLASSVTPRLTTVHFPAGELGARAGDEILKPIGGSPIEAQVELPIVLVVRGTTARASSSSAVNWRRTRTGIAEATGNS